VTLHLIFFRSPRQLVSLGCRGEFITLRFDQIKIHVASLENSRSLTKNVTKGVYAKILNWLEAYTFEGGGSLMDTWVVVHRKQRVPM
jgi:hypothetical protein